MATSISQLRGALQQAVATGQIGKVVAFRARLTAPPEMIPPTVNALVAMATELLTPSEGDAKLAGRFRIRRHSSGVQTDLLLRADSHPSLSLTWLRYSDQPASVKLLLIGNRGIVRLEEGLSPEWNSGSEPCSGFNWYETFEKSLDDPSEVVVIK